MISVFGEIFAVFVFLLIAVFLGFLYWAHLGSSKHEAYVKCSDVSKISKQNTPEKIKILSYNVIYGRVSFFMENRCRRKDIVKVLEKIGDFLRETDADIVLLQEVDHLSNQTRFLAEYAGYTDYAYATNWIRNYIPYPPWPPKAHLGRIHGGLSILSRYPIIAHERVAMPRMKRLPFYVRAFYWDNAVQSADIKVGEKLFKIFNIHQDSGDTETRENEMRILIDMIKRSSTPYVIVGGDFNAVPSIASVKNDFPDLRGTSWSHLDLTDDRTMDIFLEALPEFNEAVSTTFVLDDMHTYPADKPNRRIDYIFFSKMLEHIDGMVLNPGPISDHRAVYAELKLRTP